MILKLKFICFKQDISLQFEYFIPIFETYMCSFCTYIHVHILYKLQGNIYFNFIINEEFAAIYI